MIKKLVIGGSFNKAKLKKDGCLESFGGRVTAVSAMANVMEEAVKVVVNKILTVHFASSQGHCP